MCGIYPSSGTLNFNLIPDPSGYHYRMESANQDETFRNQDGLLPCYYSRINLTRHIVDGSEKSVAMYTIYPNIVPFLAFTTQRTIPNEIEIITTLEYKKFIKKYEDQRIQLLQMGYLQESGK